MNLNLDLFRSILVRILNFNYVLFDKLQIISKSRVVVFYEF